MVIHRTIHSLKKLPSRVRTRLSHHLVSPAIVLRDLHVGEGDVVLELGNPIGFFAPAALRTVGAPGKVVVAGANRESLSRVDYLKRNDNFETALLADVLLGKAMQRGSVDWFLLTNLLSSSLNPDHFCLSVGQYARPGARIVLLDWEAKPGAGPTRERRVTKEDAISLLKSCGMEFEKKLDTPGYQYALVFRFR